MTTSSSASPQARHTPHIVPHSFHSYGYGYGCGCGCGCGCGYYGYSYGTSSKSSLSLLRHRCAPKQQARSPPADGKKPLQGEPSCQGELHPSDVSSHSHPDATSH